MITTPVWPSSYSIAPSLHSLFQNYAKKQKRKILQDCVILKFCFRSHAVATVQRSHKIIACWQMCAWNHYAISISSSVISPQRVQEFSLVICKTAYVSTFFNYSGTLISHFSVMWGSMSKSLNKFVAEWVRS